MPGLRRAKATPPFGRLCVTANIAARGLLKRHCAVGKTPLPRHACAFAAEPATMQSGRSSPPCQFPTVARRLHPARLILTLSLAPAVGRDRGDDVRVRRRSNAGSNCHRRRYRCDGQLVLCAQCRSGDAGDRRDRVGVSAAVAHRTLIERSRALARRLEGSTTHAILNHSSRRAQDEDKSQLPLNELYPWSSQ
jgi:hypothetical protein